MPSPLFRLPVVPRHMTQQHSNTAASPPVRHHALTTPHTLSAVMHSSRVLCVAAAVACLVSTVAAFVASGGGHAIRTRAATSAGRQHVQPVQRRGVQALGASEGGGEEGGFVNPYTAFRKWQMDLVSSSVVVAFFRLNDREQHDISWFESACHASRVSPSLLPVLCMHIHSVEYNKESAYIGVPIFMLESSPWVTHVSLPSVLYCGVFMTEDGIVRRYLYCLSAEANVPGTRT